MDNNKKEGPIELSADQYMQVLYSLPNPGEYFKSSRNPIEIKYVVHLLKKTYEKPMTVVIHQGNHTPVMKSGLMETFEVEFELCFNGNIMYWQPVKPILIIPHPHRGDILKKFHDYTEQGY